MKRKGSYEEFLSSLNHFEYRLNSDHCSYRLYNPFSGETIIDTVSELCRSRSFWCPPDNTPDIRANSVVLYPVGYESRLWGRRNFLPFDGNKLRAAVSIQAACRGFLARNSVRKYYSDYWTKYLCQDSGFYYFVDRKSGISSWHKPRLAFPLDIRVQDDDRHGSYSDGPFITRAKLGKKHTMRVQLIPKAVPVVRKEEPMIDLEGQAYGIVGSWLKNYVNVTEKYQYLHHAFESKSWGELLVHMTNSKDDHIVQYYGLFCGSYLEVTYDISGIITQDVSNYLEYTLNVVKGGLSMRYGCNYMLFAMGTLLNILSTHAGRKEFLNTDKVLESLDSKKEDFASKQSSISSLEEELIRNAMIEKYLESRFDIFCRYLSRIPVEVRVDETANLRSVVLDAYVPTKRAVDFVEIAVYILCYLGYEQDSREIMAHYCTPYILETMKVCHEELTIIDKCLKAIYNFCYLSEVGHHFISKETSIGEMLEMLKGGVLMSEPEIVQGIHRLELALAEEGWRGNVEKVIAEEIQQQRQEILCVSNPEAYFKDLHAEAIARKFDHLRNKRMAAQSRSNSIQSSMSP